jgi:hypothetical protein
VSGLSLPVANKLSVEARHSPIVRRGGGAAANPPARLCGAGFGRRALAQKKRGDVFVLGCEREPAAGDQIEDLRIAHDLHDHGAEAGAGQGIDSRAQNIGRIGRAQQKEHRRIDAEFRKTARRKCAMLKRRKILDNPEHPFRSARKLRDASGEPRGRRIAGKNLVQGAAHQSAAQNRIGIRMAERAARQLPAFAQDGIEELASSFQLCKNVGHRMFTICSKYA